MSETSDRNLLSGLLALQLDFINRDQLIAAMHAWVLDKAKALEVILVDQGAIQPDTCSLLSTIVRKHLESHDGDAHESLAAVNSPPDELRRQLTVLPDAELHASLGRTSTAEVDPLFPATTPFSVEDAYRSSGRFRVMRSHQRGGLGEVFVAHDKELDREVALKEIQEKHASNEESQARFLLEARVTGGLEHPGIVPIYSLGHYEDGRPFYAMRFIRGESLNDAINRLNAKDGIASHLELHKLLGRFVDVCNAIDYAHSRGVLHRDLKPGNIMLGKYGETLVVDWGLVKLIGRTDKSQEQSAREHTLHVSSDSTATEAGEIFGTPAFMSPEQAGGRIDELGPESDVYSLGATLYCLLTGKPPLPQKSETDLPDGVKHASLTPPRVVNPSVSRPLEAVCLKALAQQPSDRYSSPRALAEDIERWLADEPVQAWPEPFSVRCWRWVSRHRMALATCVVALLAGAVVLLASQNRTIRDQNVALALARTEAEARGERASATLSTLLKDLGNVSGDDSIVDVLLSTFVNLDERLGEDPEQQIRVAKAIGGSFENLGLYTQQVAVTQRVFEIHREFNGKDHDKTIIALGNLAKATLQAGQHHVAIPLLEETVALCRQKYGASNHDTLSAINNLALAYQEIGKMSEAFTLLEEALRLRIEIGGEEHRETLTAMNSLAAAHRAAGNYSKAAELFAAAREIQERKYPDDLNLKLGLANNLGLTYLNGGNVAPALKLFNGIAQEFQHQYGRKHPYTLLFLNNVALAHHVAGDHQKSVPLFQEILESKEEVLQPADPSLTNARASLANVYDDVGRSIEAQDLFLLAVASHRATADAAKNPTMGLASTLAMLARNQLLLEKFEMAENYCREALPIMQLLAANHWRHFDAKSMLGAALAGQARYDEAEPLLLAGYEGLKERRSTIPASVSARMTDSVQRLVDVYQALDKPDEAAQWKATLDQLTGP